MVPTDGVADLYRELCGTRARFTPLRFRGDDLPHDHLPQVPAGEVADLLRSGWSLVAPLAPDLVTLDLDHCADAALLAAVDRAADRCGAVLAYRAASGSAASEHRAYAVPNGTRARFRRLLGEIRVRLDADGVVERTDATGARYRRDLDDRTADQPRAADRRGRGLRLPCSPALKPGVSSVVWPLDADGLPLLSLTLAVEMIRAARSAVEDAPGSAPSVPESDEPATPAPSSPRTVSGAPAGSRREFTSALPQVADWSTADRDRVMTSYPRGMRSDGALAALHTVVRRVGWSWSDAGEIVMTAPGFRKWSARGEVAARRWWERETSRYAAWLERRGDDLPGAPASPRGEDRARVEEWLDVAGPALLAAYPVERASRAVVAASVIGARRMLDGRGVEDRPVAVRDLVVWGAAESTGSAWRMLRDLESAGVLVRESVFTTTAPADAVRWSVPRDLQGDSGGTRFAQGVTPSLLNLSSPGSCPPSLTGPRRLLLGLLLGSPSSAPTLTQVLGCSVRSVQRWLSSLGSLGLVARSGSCWSALVGVSGVSSVVGSSAACVEEVRAAESRRDAAVRRVEEERRGWREMWQTVADAAGGLVHRFRWWCTDRGVRRSRAASAARVEESSVSVSGWFPGRRRLVPGSPAVQLSLLDMSAVVSRRRWPSASARGPAAPPVPVPSVGGSVGGLAGSGAPSASW
jgi:hypothetical protein